MGLLTQRAGDLLAIAGALPETQADRSTTDGFALLPERSLRLAKHLRSQIGEPQPWFHPAFVRAISLASATAATSIIQVVGPSSPEPMILCAYSAPADQLATPLRVTAAAAPAQTPRRPASGAQPASSPTPNRDGRSAMHRPVSESRNSPTPPMTAEEGRSSHVTGAIPRLRQESGSSAEGTFAPSTSAELRESQLAAIRHSMRDNPNHRQLIDVSFGPPRSDVDIG